MEPTRSQGLVPETEELVLPVHPNSDLYDNTAYVGDCPQKVSIYQKIKVNFPSCIVLNSAPSTY